MSEPFLGIKVYHGGKWHDIPNDGRVDVTTSDENQRFRVSATPEGLLNIRCRHHRPLIDVDGNDIEISTWRGEK